MEQVGRSLISQGCIFVGWLLGVEESSYSYSSLLGTSVTMEFDWERERSTLAYLGSKELVCLKDFRSLVILY